MDKIDSRSADRRDYINPRLWINVTPSDFTKKGSFYLNVLGMFKTVSGYELVRSNRPDYQVIFTTEGGGAVEAGGKRFSAEKNHICLIDCSKPHSYKAYETWDFWWLHAGGAGMKHIYEHLMQLAPEGVILSHSSEMTGLFNRLARITKDNYTLTTPMQSLIIHNILYLAIAAAQNNRLYKPYFKDVFDYIEKHYGDQITIDDLARLAHKSRYYFMRQFKKLTGETPYQHIINYRINQAKIMLETTDEPVTEIAKRCGFLDESNFINQFKKQESVTPLEYRKALQ